MAKYNIDVAVKNTSLGEGPHWVEDHGELIYVDIPGQEVHRYDPKTGKDYFIPIDGRPSLIVPVESQPNKYIIGLERDLVELEWDGVSAQAANLRSIVTVEDAYPKNRFNDGKCDPQGRLWAGTMGYETTPGAVDPGKGNLYKLGLDGQLSSHVDKIDISNGLTWSNDSSKFFYIDSCAFSVDVFDFNAEDGTLSNRRVLYHLSKDGIPGLPDGMTTDANNNLWVAVHCGGQVLHIDSTTGQLIDTIDFTGISSNLTSVAWGGPNLDELYVTSAKFRLSPEQLAVETNPGALFKVTNLGTRGLSGGVSYKGKL